jgi:hypothetical protein
MRTSGRFEAEQEAFSGRIIDVPSCFIAARWRLRMELLAAPGMGHS